MLYTKEQYQYLRLTLSFRVQLVDWFEEFDSESRDVIGKGDGISK